MRNVLLSSLLLAAALVSSTHAAPAPAAPRSVKRAVPKQVLPWIEDDWTRAVATARARKLPIFVESWAPW